MYDNNKILSALKTIKKRNGIIGADLVNVIQNQLQITPAGDFIKHLEKDKKFITHDSKTTQYFITKEGEQFIIRQTIINFTKHPVTIFILAFIAIIIAIIALC